MHHAQGLNQQVSPEPAYMQDVHGRAQTQNTPQQSNHLLEASKKQLENDKLKKPRKTDNRTNTDLRTEEDKRVDEDKWLYKDNYETLVADGTLIGHRGNPDGIIRSTYWMDKK